MYQKVVVNRVGVLAVAISFMVCASQLPSGPARNGTTLSMSSGSRSSGGVCADAQSALLSYPRRMRAAYLNP
ncbi:MAG TPA: hypothetical protein VE971_00305 [Candidatus Eisenbacteria bacterium]|nr:hypothetical protein [Candidatus Eisenbacteria bacterium]